MVAGIVGNMFRLQLSEGCQDTGTTACDGQFCVKSSSQMNSGRFYDGRRKDTDVFYSFSGFATPPTTYRYNMITGVSTLYRKADVKLNQDDYKADLLYQ